MMAFCLKKIDIIQFFTPTVLSISLKYIKHCANIVLHGTNVLTDIWMEIFTGSPGKGKTKAKGRPWDTNDSLKPCRIHCFSRKRKEVNMPHDSLPLWGSLLSETPTLQIIWP